MKQSKSIISPAVGTTTEMMIRVEWTRRTVSGPSVEFAEGVIVAGLLAGIAEESAVSERAAIFPMNVGKLCDGGTVAVHSPYPNSHLNEEYASLRNSLYAALL